MQRDDGTFKVAVEIASMARHYHLLDARDPAIMTFRARLGPCILGRRWAPVCAPALVSRNDAELCWLLRRMYNREIGKMSAIDSTGVTWGPRVLSVLRFVTGFLYFWHGMQKAVGFPMAPNAAYQALDWMTLRGA